VTQQEENPLSEADKMESKMQVLQVGVQVIFLKEEDYIVAYAPALELSSYGKSEYEAKKAFEEVISIFIEETQKKGTFERILIKLGWTLSKVNYEPPKYSPEELFKLFKTRSAVNVMEQSVPMPVAYA